jgi:formate hydrogenlyase subunit 4
MIHEVMVLDHSGPEFACITYAASLKFALLGSFFLHVAIPHPGWLGPAEPGLRFLELVALGAVVGTVESVTARLRLNRVPLLLAGAGVLSSLAVVLVLRRGLA